jgi:hypothetical protein
MTYSIFQTLKKLGLSSEQTREIYNNKTRDVNDVNVWKDSVSGVIYIDDFYTGDETYTEGSYRDEECKIVRHTEIKHKCCKDVVKTDLPLANRCYIRVSKTATIEWE